MADTGNSPLPSTGSVPVPGSETTPLPNTSNHEAESVPAQPPTAAAPLASDQPAQQANTTPRPEKLRKPDALHESLETIVFVVFLVVLLKAFVAEAFVIPTGSMATTLLGYNRTATCDKCGWKFPVNAADETELGHRHSGPITEAMCTHCGHLIDLRSQSHNGPGGGDKVLVFKPAYDIGPPERFNVIVFKFPGQPQEQFVAKNYIKRLWGLPGEKLAILYGDVFLRSGPQGNENLQILRKPPAQQLEMRRIVYHNDYQRSDLVGIVPPRWADEDPTPSWTVSQDLKSFSIQPSDQAHTLHYRHYYHSMVDELLAKLQDRESRLANERNPAPGLKEEIRQLKEELTARRLITDTLGYNTYKAEDQFGWQPQSWNWVRDLMIECDVEIAQPNGELTLQLASGMDKHEAVFNLATGQCTLRVLRKDQTRAQKDSPTSMSRAGKYHLRFGNFDERLTLWVDGKLVFGDGLEFASPNEEERGPCVADLHPAAIIARNASLKVQHLQLWRDIYYTRTTSSRGAAELSEAMNDTKIGLTSDELKLFVSPYEKPTKWAAYSHHVPQFYDVKSGEYFALGDNSTFSSDSRDWGGVPERLLLGRAVFVYWPILRFGPIW